MQRIKIPYGRVTADQLDTLSQVAEEYSDRILHVTTRQDFQLHFVHIEDTPDLHRRLAAVGITTREACGNTVRNVTSCPYAGVCREERFDVTPYAHALTFFLLGHDDTQDFGRKFKVAFSGCKENACGLTNFHDIGAIARTREVDGRTHRGFELVVGGGLGAVPQNALLFDEFLPEEELLPIAQAISRVFSRLGERQNRARARFKFVVKKLGIEETKRLVLEERAKLRPDYRVACKRLIFSDATKNRLRPPGPRPAGPLPAGFARWRETNVVRQRQPGYVMALVTLPLGDLTSEQGRALADIARRFTGDTMRTTADQNLLLRWVSEADLPDLYSALGLIHLAEPGAGTLRHHGHLGTARARRHPHRPALAAHDQRPSGSASTGPQRQAPAHQGQRLLQFVRSAPRRRSRFPRSQPQRGGAARAALPAGRRRPVDA
jgi:sulfite reductase (ferredoxin)